LRNTAAAERRSRRRSGLASDDNCYRGRKGLRTVIFMMVADAMVTCPKTHGLDTVVDEIRAFFVDDHVHMALIVASDRRLVTTIERPDLPASSSGSSWAVELGALPGRTVAPSAALDAVTAALLRDQRRRLAVVDDRGRLIGLLCLKKSGTGYCSDGDVRERAEEAEGGSVLPCYAPASVSV
jgi:CBS-domain-containing membrane protein